MNLNATLKLDSAGFVNPLAGARTALAGFSQALNQSVGSFGAWAASLVGVGTVVLGFKKAISGAADLEDFTIAFKTLLGSGSQGQALSDSLVKLTASTHLSLDALAGASKSMLQFGVAGDQLVPKIQQIAEVSGGNAERFASLALVFGQTASAGKLMGQDLLQYINAGFNPLSEIALKTGKSMGQLRTEMEAGNITFQQVSDAFAAATSEGGRFFGFLEARSKGAKGLFAMLQNSISNVFREFGKPVNDALKPLLEQAGGIMDQLKAKAGEWGKIFATGVGTLRSLLGDGSLGQVLNLSLQVGLGEAVNYGAGLIAGLAEAAGVLLGGAIKSSLILFEALGTADFWSGLANELAAAALGFVALLEKLLAGVFDSLGDIKGAGFLKGTATSLRKESAADLGEAGAIAHHGGGELRAYLDKTEANAKATVQEMANVIVANLKGAPQIMDVKKQLDELQKKLVNELPKNVLPAPEEDRNIAKPKDGALTSGGKERAVKLPEADRLTKIGMLVGGQINGSSNAAQRTADNTTKMATGITRLADQMRDFLMSRPTGAAAGWAS